MPVIFLSTSINAPIQRCFDLARSIDLHMISTRGTGEKAIAGKTSGLIEFQETVTWRAWHFGVRQKLTSRITAFDPPYYFTDEMERGAFRHLRHEHFFERFENITVMSDRMDYSSPFGKLGKTADRLFLKSYLEKLLRNRNSIIKDYAESDKWQQILQ